MIAGMEPPRTAQGGASVHRTSPNDWFEPDTHRPSQSAKYLVIANDVPNDLVEKVSELHAIAAQASARRAESTQRAIEGSPS